MNRHVGASFTLSVLFVVFFAVILYEPDRAHPPQTPSAPKPAPKVDSASPSTSAETPPATPVASTESQPPPPDVPIPAPAPASASASAPAPKIESSPKPLLKAGRPPTRPVDVAAAPTSPPPPATPKAPAPVPAPAPAAAPTVPVVTTTAPPVSAAPRPAKPHRPAAPPARRTAFTEVEDGETLADVSLRVYGTTDAATPLWRANRDVIPRRDAPLTAGLVLRTP